MADLAEGKGPGGEPEIFIKATCKVKGQIKGVEKLGVWLCQRRFIRISVATQS